MVVERDCIELANSFTRRPKMNKDQVSGRAEELKGKIKEAAGKATDNDRLEAQGKADQLTGKVKAGYGDAKEKVKDAIDKA
jgi:uncharacterized protein YjbJ (UPF0337 family)